MFSPVICDNSAVTAVADFHRFQRDVPAALLLIQTTQKEVHLSMNRLIRMIAPP